MNTIITGKNFNVSDANKTFVESKVSGLIQIDSTISTIKVELDAEKKERDNGKFRAEIWVDGKHPAKAGSHGRTFFEAVDSAIQKVKRQIVKDKEKQRLH